MNRIAGYLLLGLLPLPAFAQLTGEDKKSADGLEYVLKKPKVTQKAPVMILLHGDGGDLNVFAETPDGWAPSAERNGYIVVVPKGQSWADADRGKVLNLANEILKTYGADSKRVVLGGFSSGGFRAVEWGLTNPDLFSAVLCVAGGSRVDADKVPDEAKDLGVYFVHGTADKHVKFEETKKFSDALKAKGFKTLVFKEMKGEDHMRFNEEAPAFFKWVKDISKKFVAGSCKSLPWEIDLAAATKKAADEKKIVMIYFYGDKDSANAVAEGFETELFRDKDVIEALQEAVCVKVNRDRDKDAAKELKVGKPSIVLVGPDRKKISAQEEKTTPKQFVEKIKRALPKK